MTNTNPKILVVDDDLDTLAKIYIELLLKNFIVEVTNDAQEITERAMRFEPDLLILNNDLPGLDAHEVCTKLKRQQNIPIILLVDKNSGETTKIDSCTADAVYTKPIDIKELKKIITSLMVTTQH